MLPGFTAAQVEQRHISKITELDMADMPATDVPLVPPSTMASRNSLFSTLAVCCR
jgi:hypothetical protein